MLFKITKEFLMTKKTIRKILFLIKNYLSNNIIKKIRSLINKTPMNNYKKQLLYNNNKFNKNSSNFNNFNKNNYNNNNFNNNY